MLPAISISNFCSLDNQNTVSSRKRAHYSSKPEKELIEGTIHIGDATQDDPQSVGFIFEPDSVTAYFYSDGAAKKISGYRKFASSRLVRNTDLKKFHPSFALSFVTEWTLVPQSIFEEKDCESFLSFNTSFSNGRAQWERLIGLDAVLIYKKNEEADSILGNLFPGLRLKHGIGSLLEFCRQKQNKSSGTSCFLHASGSQYTLVIYQKTELIFANSFTASNAEDARYFVLFTLKVLAIKEDYTLNLLGEVIKNTSLIAALQKYIPTMLTTFAPNELLTPDVSKYLNANPEAGSEHWIGIYAELCAL